MTLSKTIESLSTEQIRSVIGLFDISVILDSFHILPEKKKDFLSGILKEELVKIYEKRRKLKFNKDYQIMLLWSDDVYQVINKKSVKQKENEDIKKDLLSRLKKLNTPNTLDDSDLIENIVRDILVFLWKDSTQKEKKKFINAIRENENLKDYTSNFISDEELESNIYSVLIGGSSKAPLVASMIASYVLPTMTQDLIAWFSVAILGQKALQVATLGALASPVGIGVAVGTFGVGTIVNSIRKQSDKRRFQFIEAIFSIYAYRYQNRLNKRREANEG